MITIKRPFALALMLGTALSGVAAMTPANAADAGPAMVVNLPTTEPVPDDGNLPFGSAKFANSRDYGDFARYGYVEKEFYLTGKASTRDQESGQILQADLPYVSRIVVRMPANPKAFSGNVIVEPFHALVEKTDMWLQLHRRITERGDIWIGVTVKAYGRDMEPDSAYALGGIPVLKAYDPVRYGRLHLEPDMRALYPAPPAPTPPQALDLMTQVGALAKTNGAGSPLAGYQVKKVYATGSGIGGEVVANYVRTQHEAWKLADGRQIFDGYFYGITGRFPPQSLKNAALVMYRGTNETDRAAVAGFIGKTPNTASARVYNIVGLSHINSRDIGDNEPGLWQINSVLPNAEADMPKMPYVEEPKMNCPNMNDEPVDLALSALLVGMEEWGSKGTPLPASPDPIVAPGDADAPMGSLTGSTTPGGKRVFLIKTNPVTGIALGGVRMPWVDAPIASYPVFDPKMGRPRAAPGDIMHGGGALPPGGMPPGGMAPGGMPPGGMAPGGMPPGNMGGMPPGGMPPMPMAVVEPSDAWPLPSKAKTKLPTKPGPPMQICFLFNPRVPLDKTALHTLYKSYDDYVAQFDAAKERAVRARWLLKDDAASLRPRGTAADFQ